MNKIMYPDYDNCIANLACSVIKYFGGKAPNGTLPLADGLLDREYKNVVVLLLDGMGRNIMENSLDERGFFRSNLRGVYSSTFPPTTVAATTAVLSGLYPNQSLWLGWEGYFPQIDKNVVYFLNTDQYGESAADYNVAWRYCPYVSITDRIMGAGGNAYFSNPYEAPFPKTIDEVLGRVSRLCAEDGRKYIYAYWDQPDGVMHEKGCCSPEAVSVTRELESKVYELSKGLEDTLLIVTADHGHIDSRGEVITEHKEIYQCLERMPSFEPRALNLFVKKGMEKAFEERFNEAFGEDFLLMTKAQVLKEKLFGKGENAPGFEDMLGDYIAAATGDLSVFNFVKQKERFIGVHAGLTENETVIPLIAITA